MLSAATQDFVVPGSSESARTFQAKKIGQIAFAATALFTAQLYLSPAQWLPVTEPLHIALVLSTLGVTALVLRRVLVNQPLWMGWRTGLLAIYVVTAVLSPMWSIDRPATVTAALEVAKHFVFFLALVNTATTPGRIRTALLLYAAAAIVPAWGTFWNYIHDELLVEGFRGRWLGVMADPNHDCMGLVGVVPILLFFAIGSKQHWAKRLIGLGGVAACLAGIIATHSRGGSVGLAASVVIFALMSRRKALASVAVLVAAAGVLVLAPTTFWQRNETIAGYAEDMSVQGRMQAWQVAFRILHEKPVLGVGEGAFLKAWDQFAPIDAGPNRYVAHNLFLEVLGELGLVGLFGMVSFLAAGLWSAWRARNGELGGEARAIFAALVGYLICQLFSGYSLSWFTYALCGFAACCDVWAPRASPAPAVANEDSNNLAGLKGATSWV